MVNYISITLERVNCEISSVGKNFENSANNQKFGGGGVDKIDAGGNGGDKILYISDSSRSLYNNHKRNVKTMPLHIEFEVSKVSLTSTKHL